MCFTLKKKDCIEHYKCVPVHLQFDFVISIYFSLILLLIYSKHISMIYYGVLFNHMEEAELEYYF